MLKGTGRAQDKQSCTALRQGVRWLPSRANGLDREKTAVSGQSQLFNMHSSQAQTCCAIALRQPMARLNLMRPLMPCLSNGTKQPTQLAIAIRCQWSPTTEGDHPAGGSRAGLCSTAAITRQGHAHRARHTALASSTRIASGSRSQLNLMKILSLLRKAPAAKATGAGGRSPPLPSGHVREAAAAPAGADHSMSQDASDRADTSEEAQLPRQSASMPSSVCVESRFTKRPCHAAQSLVRDRRARKQASEHAT